MVLCYCVCGAFERFPFLFFQGHIMATPSDDTKNAATKAAKKSAVKKAPVKQAPAKKSASKSTASKTAKKAVKKSPTQATKTKTGTNKASAGSSGKRLDSEAPVEFDFSDRVEVEVESAQSTSKNQRQASEGWEQIKSHAVRGLGEIATAATAGLDLASQKLDAASIVARRKSKEALKASEQWVKENPVAASVAGSAVVGTISAVLKKALSKKG